MRILFYDLGISGHHSEYIGHIINYIYKNPDDNEYYFLLHPEFSLNFPDIIISIKRTDNVKCVEVTKNEFENTLMGGIAKRSFSNFNLLNNYANKYKINHVILLYFNIFQLALIFKTSKYTIDGILFKPFYRMKTSSIKEKLLYLKKYLQTKLFLINNNIKHIYILNDEKTVEYLNDLYRKKTFKVLHDPTNDIIPKDNFSISDYHGFETERKVFLHFGSLTERKGTIELLDSLKYLDNNSIKRITILLIGKADISFENQINKIIEDLKIEKPSLSIFFRNKFISEQEMKCYFDQSDYFLLPYKNVESSSGVLGHAILANKPILSVKKGLIEDIVLQHNLGVLIDTVTPNKIKEGIEKLLNSDIKIIKREAYINKHSPTNFAKTLLNF